MEGGILPWRVQKADGVKYASYDRILDPLPPPPAGLKWVKVRVEDDGGAFTRWELVEKLKLTTGGADDEELPQEKVPDPDFVEHVVMPTDTVLGLRLRYKISMAELRKYNDFCGESFQMCDVLRIPIKGREEAVLNNAQKQTKDVLRQRFKATTRCGCDQVTSYYLDFCDWNLKQAIEDYETDKQWEEEQAAKKQAAAAALAAVAASTAPPRRVTPPAPLAAAPSGPPPRYSLLFPLGRPKKKSAALNAGGKVPMKEFVSDTPLCPPGGVSLNTPLLRDYENQVTTDAPDGYHQQDVYFAVIAERTPLLAPAVRNG